MARYYIKNEYSNVEHQPCSDGFSYSMISAFLIKPNIPFNISNTGPLCIRCRAGLYMYVVPDGVGYTPELFDFF